MRSRIAVLVAALCIAAGPVPFRYIVVDGSTLRSTNAVPVEVRAPSKWHLLGPTSRHAIFDGHPYEVSLAALASTNTAVMLHAEKVADGSGVSNYDKLPNSPWTGFHMRSQCAAIAAADVEAEHDLKWLADRGWNPVGDLALEQHLKSTADHNQEIVVSLMAKVKSCADKRAVNAAITKLRSQIRVTTD